MAKHPAEPMEKTCASCAYAVALQNTGVGVCRKTNEVVRLTGKCGKYELDLLHLRPRLPLLPDSEQNAPFPDPRPGDGSPFQP